MKDLKKKKQTINFLVVMLIIGILIGVVFGGFYLYKFVKNYLSEEIKLQMSPTEGAFSFLKDNLFKGVLEIILVVLMAVVLVKLMKERKCCKEEEKLKKK